MIIDGNPSKVRCINVVGLKRNGISAEAIAALHEAHRLIYRARMTASTPPRSSSRTATLSRGQEPARFHREPAPRQARPGPGTLENDMKRLRVGVVGVGHLGQHHARILSAMPGVELVAVADARPEQAQAVAAEVRHRGPRRLPATARTGRRRHDRRSHVLASRSRRRLPGTRASPPWSKSPWPARWPRPSSSSPWPAAARAVLQVGHIERFNPALCERSRRLAIRPKYITAERLSTYTFRSTDIGVVLDLMIHDLDLLLSLIAAPVRSVAAVGVSLFGEHEDVANARIEFEDGSVANLTASRASYTAVRKMRIWGAEGYASLDFAAKEATAGPPVRTAQARPARPRRGRPEPADRGQEHLFGKILRVDRVQAEGREPLALELEDFVNAGPRALSPPSQRRRRLACDPSGRPDPASSRSPPLGRRIPLVAGRRPHRQMPIRIPRATFLAHRTMRQTGTSSSR